MTSKLPGDSSIWVLTGCLVLLSVAIVLADSPTTEHPPTGRRLCLTFDDAPNGEGAILTGKERTQRLISQFEELGIEEVAFFCVTERLHYHHGHERLRQYAAAGHLIANHSHSHPSPESNGALSYIAGIREAHDSLTQFSTFTPWFRYPMLNEGKTVPVRDSIRGALKSLGLTNGYVTIDTWEWYLDRRWKDAAKEGLMTDTTALGDIYVAHTLWETIQFYDQMARDLLGYSPDHVLLLHENDLAALFIGDLVRHLRANNWKIIPASEAYEDPIADCIPDVLLNNQGRIVAIAAERAHKGPLRHYSESSEYMDSLLTARQVFTATSRQ